MFDNLGEIIAKINAEACLKLGLCITNNLILLGGGEGGEETCR